MQSSKSDSTDLGGEIADLIRLRDEFPFHEDFRYLEGAFDRAVVVIERLKGACAARSAPEQTASKAETEVSEAMANAGIKELRYYLDYPHSPMGRVVIDIYWAMESARAK